MKFRLYMNGEWHLLADIPLTKKNNNRVKLIGNEVASQLAINHKIGIMDMNDALDKLFDLSEKQS